MTKCAFTVKGIGCGLGDLIFGNVDFSHPRALPYHSKAEGDGGLQMGRLVFVSDLLAYADLNLETMLSDLTQDSSPDVFNVGGPALVSLILSSQLLAGVKIPVSFYGVSGQDETSKKIREILKKTPLKSQNYREVAGHSPSTYVLSDPRAHDGNGDRCFVNDIGVCVSYGPNSLPADFFSATVNVYGGTALVPLIHQNLAQLLQKGRAMGAINVVGTVYDFISEKTRPGQPWGLGEGNPWPFIDLLVSDKEEILKITGESEIQKAMDSLIQKGLCSILVTQGPDPVLYKSIGGVFGNAEGQVLPFQSLAVKVKNRSENPGDTTGAGDNFLGGVVAGLVLQLWESEVFPRQVERIERESLHMNPFHLHEAAKMGAAAGGLACLQYGGTQIETFPGEKLGAINVLFETIQ